MALSINDFKKNIKGLKPKDLIGGPADLIAKGLTGKSQADMIQDKVNEVIAPPKVQGADPSGLQQQADTLLNPVADQFQQFANSSQVTSNVDPAFRQYQLGLAAQLQQQATGQGPSIAQMQLQQATDRSLNQSIGAIRSATGANAGLNARTAALAGSQQMGQMGANSAILRLQEQQQAQNMLGGLANQGRTGDIATNGQNIQAQQYSMGNKLAGLQGLGNTRMGQLGVQQNIYGQQNQAAIAQDQARNGRNNAILGGLGNLATTAFGAFSGGAPAAAPLTGAVGSQGLVTQPRNKLVDDFGNPIA